MQKGRGLVLAWIVVGAVGIGGLAACLTGRRSEGGGGRYGYDFENNPNYYADGVYQRDWWFDGFPHEPFEREHRFDNQRNEHRGHDEFRNDRGEFHRDRDEFRGESRDHRGGERDSGFRGHGGGRDGGFGGGGSHGR